MSRGLDDVVMLSTKLLLHLLSIVILDVMNEQRLDIRCHRKLSCVFVQKPSKFPYAR